jgi:DNA-binding MarR family transcriptional regulator
MIAARRARAAAFGPDLFADPAWDMMLELLLARIERRPVCVSKLCLASGVPQTTAIRWISALVARGLLERSADPSNGRRILVDLSDAAAARLRRLLLSVRAENVPFF